MRKAKLGRIKSSVLRWEAGAQPPQILADGEVVMTTAYNGRIFNAVATVNGLAIHNEIPTLGFYFEKYVIAGASAVAMEANDYRQYAVAILRKLIREIGNPAVS